MLGSERQENVTPPQVSADTKVMGLFTVKRQRVLMLIFSFKHFFLNIQLYLKHGSICNVEGVEEERVKGTEDGFSLSWKPPRRNITSYLVEWCEHPRDPPCDLQWKTLGPSATATVVSSGKKNPACCHLVPPTSQQVQLGPVHYFPASLC